MSLEGCGANNLCVMMGVALLTIIGLARDVTSLQEEVVKEYCEDNTFEGRCGENEVIMMTSATYGRMRMGTCLLTNYGHRPCSSDILTIFDQWCSGRPSCDVRVSDLVNKVPQPCPKDLRNYLEASYKCVKVIWPTVQKCDASSNPLVTMESGFLSNYVTTKTKCGGIDSPWIIRVAKGQQINLTLYDFAYSTDVAVSQPADICQVLAVIKDRGSGPGSSTTTSTICNGRHRIEHLMTSHTNEVELRFMLKSTRPVSDTDGRYHVVRFEAVGCPDVEQPNMWFHRTKSSARVGCEGGDDSWKLACDGKEWRGDIPDCSAGAVLPRNDNLRSGTTVPYGVSVAIILAIALMIGAVILTVGLVVIRRRRNRCSRGGGPTGPIQHDPNKLSNKDDCYIERMPYTDQGPVTAGGYHLPDSPYNGENTYYRTWQLQRHVPQGAPMSHACAASVPPPGYQGTRMREDSPPRYMEHIYESPKSVRREVDALNAAADSLKYYELDPGNSSDISLKKMKDPDGTS